MNNSRMTRYSILDLPNEILLIIFNKLNTIDIFYSIIDVNERFYRLILNSPNVQDLQMTTTMNVDTCYEQTSPIDTKLLSRICKNILPEIHHQVYKLTIDQSSMKAILHAANYPQLYSLSIIDIQEELLHDYLTSIVLFFIDLIR